MKQNILQVNQIYKSFDDPSAVNGVSFVLDEGQILCLLGPSGCGKTTLLRLIAGLEIPDSGSILFEGQDFANVPPHQRDFGLMFQEFALFPHKNVGQNVAFGLQMKREAKITSRVQEMLELVGLAGFEERDVNSLSGGERQRVALARSLAPNPRLLMLDEPLGSLDRALRERLMLEIRQILKQVGLTAIYVTHDQTEAFAVADRVIVMNQGHIEQEATAEQLYHQPSTPFVARFLGFTNLLEATCLSNGRIETSLGIWPIKTPNRTAGEKVMVLIRPEAASLEPNPDEAAGASEPEPKSSSSSRKNSVWPKKQKPKHRLGLHGLDSVDDISIEGELVASLFRGRFYQLTISTRGNQLTFELPLTKLPPLGNELRLWLNPAAILVLDKP